MHLPAFIIAFRVIGSKVSAAGFFAPQGGACDERRDRQKVSRSRAERCMRDLLELLERAQQRFAAANYSNALPHQAAHAFAYRQGDLAGADAACSRSRYAVRF